MNFFTTFTFLQETILKKVLLYNESCQNNSSGSN